jgi:hypothetical protein
MRQERIMQASIFDIFAEHEIGRELRSISDWLDEQSSLLNLVIGDLRRHAVQETGRHGLTRWRGEGRSERWRAFCSLLHALEGRVDASIDCLVLCDDGKAPEAGTAKTERPMMPRASRMTFSTKLNVYSRLRIVSP